MRSPAEIRNDLSDAEDMNDAKLVKALRKELERSEREFKPTMTGAQKVAASFARRAEIARNIRLDTIGAADTIDDSAEHNNQAFAN